MTDSSRRPSAFVSLRSLTSGASDPASVLAELRQIYFKTSRRTIDNDFTHALALLKSLPDEDTRAKAHVYMEGLAEMAREWGKRTQANETRAAKATTPGNGKKKRR